MKRLQSNLAYLAAIADRSHKPASQIHAHPAIMKAPLITSRPSTSSAETETKMEESDEKKADVLLEERIENLKVYYKQLQALFPGVDPNKEPSRPPPNPQARTQAQQQAIQIQAAQQAQNQKMQSQNQGTGLDQQQQKMQQEIMRQKMMQQAHQQQAQNQHMMAQQQQGMQGMNSQSR